MTDTHSQSEHGLTTEPDNDDGAIAALGWTVAVVVVLIISVVVLVTFVQITGEREIHRKQTMQSNVELLELRAQEHKRLNAYGVVDKARALVHIPIERAMELEALRLRGN